MTSSIKQLLKDSLIATFCGITASSLSAQTAPLIEDYHILDSNEPALVGLLDSGDRFGRDFNALGDLDLDGVPDFLVGARSDDDGATDAGAFYILFMNRDGSVKDYTKVSASTGGLTEAGVTLTESQLFGYAVTTVGDLDGDSIQDIAVGARRDGATADGGVIYILFLNRDGSVKSAQTISNSLGNLGHPLQSTDFFGEGAISLGTINGMPTLAVSDSYNDDGGNNRGAIYLLRLNPDGTAMPGQTVKISSTSGGFGPGLANSDRFGGRDITPLGDIDGDGHLDLAVSSFHADDKSGALWILLLNADLTVKATQKIGQGIGGLQATLNADDNFGHCVTGPGDLDGDGIPDLITSSNLSDNGGDDIGELYYLFLNADGTVKSETRVSQPSGLVPFTLPARGRFGRTMALLGDLKGDGSQCIAAGGGAGNTGVIHILFTRPASELLLSDPRAIPGNVLWLDASDLDGDFTTGGSFLGDTQWVDKSSAANAHASQATSTQRPITTQSLNGLSVVSFDGNDFMDIDSAAFGMLRNTAGATVFTIARPTSVPTRGGHRVFMASTGANSASTRAGFNFFDEFGTNVGGSGNAGLAGRRLDTDGYQRINGGAPDLSKFSIWTGEFDYTNGALRLYEDGTLLTASTIFQTPGHTSDTDSLNIRLGADAALTEQRGLFTGDLAELIVYDRVLLPSERNLVEQYLTAKWSEPKLAITGDGQSVTLSWPVTPIPWQLESSTNLLNFAPMSAIPNQQNNELKIAEPTIRQKTFYRLTRP